MKTNIGYLDEFGRECHEDLGKKTDAALEMGDAPDTLAEIIQRAVNEALVKADIARGPATNEPDDLYDWDEEPDYSTMSEHSLELQEMALHEELERLELHKAQRAKTSPEPKAADGGVPPTNEAGESPVPVAGATKKSVIDASRKQ